MNTMAKFLTMPRKEFAWYVTGLCDGEAWFQVRPKTCIDKRYDKVSKGFSVLFGMQVREDDKELLEMLNIYFGIGSISTRHRKGKILGEHQYSIYGAKNAQVVIKHFDKYPLLGKKRRDYEAYKAIVNRLYSPETDGLPNDWEGHLQDYLEIVEMCDDLRLGRLPKGTPLTIEELLKQKGGSTDLYLPQIINLLVQTGELMI